MKQWLYYFSLEIALAARRRYTMGVKKLIQCYQM